MILFTLFASACFGLLIGSFLNVVILRLPHDETLGGRSHCTACNHPLSGPDLVPVLSYVFLWGRCRYCRHRISPRYAIIELFTAVLFAVAAGICAPDTVAEWLGLLRWFVILAVAIVTFVVDWEHYIILDEVTGWGTVLVLALACASAGIHGGWQEVWHVLQYSAYGAGTGVVLFWLLWRVSRGRLLGFGDVKFMVFMGAATGFPRIVPGIVFSFWLGAVVAIPLLLLGRKQLGSRIPFGVFLAPGMLIALIWGQQVVQWYGRMAGLW